MRVFFSRGTSAQGARLRLAQRNDAPDRRQRRRSPCPSTRRFGAGGRGERGGHAPVWRTEPMAWEPRGEKPAVGSEP